MIYTQLSVKSGRGCAARTQRALAGPHVQSHCPEGTERMGPFQGHGHSTSSCHFCPQSCPVLGGWDPPGVGNPWEDSGSGLLEQKPRWAAGTGEPPLRCLAACGRALTRQPGRSEGGCPEFVYTAANLPQSPPNPESATQSNDKLYEREGREDGRLPPASLDSSALPNFTRCGR